MLQPKILVKKQLAPEDIEISFSQAQRKSSKEIEDIIEQEWNNLVAECKKRNIKIWNGRIKCLNSFEFDNQKLKLNLGETTFKELIGTHAHSNNVCEKFGKEYSAKGMHVGGLVITKDNYFVFGKRRWRKTSDAGGKISVFGGLLDEDWPIQESKDLFKAFEGELKQELGIKQKHIQNTKFLAFIRTIKGKYAFYFLTNLSISKSQTEKAFRNNADDEHEKILFCQNNAKNIKLFLSKHKDKICSSVKIALKSVNL